MRPHFSERSAWGQLGAGGAAEEGDCLVHDQVLLENIRCGDGTVHSMRGGESVVTYQGVASLSPSQGFHPRCASVAYVHCVSYGPRPIA